MEVVQERGLVAPVAVNQLKFWLRCRGINQSGNRQALYERLSSCCACCFVFFFFVHSRIRLCHLRNLSSVT